MVTPGLINTHHHMFRASRRAVPAALVLAGPLQVRDMLVDDRDVVRDGALLTLDLQPLPSQAARAVRRLSA